MIDSIVVISNPGYPEHSRHELTSCRALELEFLGLESRMNLRGTRTANAVTDAGERCEGFVRSSPAAMLSTSRQRRRWRGEADSGVIYWGR